MTGLPLPLEDASEKRAAFNRDVTVFLAGLSGAVVLFFTSLAWSAWLPIPITILFIAMGLIFGYFYPKAKWRVGVLLMLPYLVLITWIVVATIIGNAKWEGVYWRTEIFYTTIYLDICPVIAGLFAILFASSRNFYFVIVLIALVAGLAACERYCANHSIISRSSNRSIELESEVTRLKIDIDCKYTRHNDFRGFRYYDEDGCGSGLVTVISKDPRHSLPRNAIWLIDGVELPGWMSPLNGPDGRSTIGRPEKNAYDEVRKWRATIPIKSMQNAQQVNFRWGDITIQLREDQIQSLNKLEGATRRLR